MREYKNNRFGGLGPNLGTKEWSRRAIKFRKMNEYGVNVVANFQGVKKYKRESPDEERKLNLERIYKKSKRYITKKYGEGVMLNKLRKQKEMERLEKEFYEQNLLQEQNEGTRKVERVIAYYNLDMIISVGYRVHSYRGVQFRIWATKVLKEYIVKGFAMNDDLLKRAGGGNYFDELLARIRDIRSSEKVFYRKVLEIYALSIDYDPRVEMTQKFFKTVQNKMHYSVHGHTAAEIIYERADAEKDFMGLTTWSGAMPSKPEAEIAKNGIR